MNPYDDQKPTTVVSPNAIKARQGLNQSCNHFSDAPRYGDSGLDVMEPTESTVLVGTPVSSAQPVETVDFMRDPVVGWLVVIQGAGQGTSMPLGYGANHIGRDADQRVKLSFGDKQISRKQHAVLTYEPKGRKFYLQNGGGINLTYLLTDDSNVPVLMPVMLENGQRILLGDTTLQFVALCGEAFDWANVSRGNHV